MIGHPDLLTTPPNEMPMNCPHQQQHESSTAHKKKKIHNLLNTNQQKHSIHKQPPPQKKNKTFRQSNSHFRASRATSAIWFKCGHCSGKFLHISWKFVWISVDPFGTRSPRKNQVRQALASVNPSLLKAYRTKATTTDNGDVNIFKWSWSRGHFVGLFFLERS